MGSKYQDPKGEQVEQGTQTGRSYIDMATKAATHPVRSCILKSLKEGDKSTVDLEKLTGETRYNLYHHLNALEQVGLISWDMKDNRTKIYRLERPSSHQAAVLIFNEEDIRNKPEEFKALINALSKMEGEEIPRSNEIVSAQICLNYSSRKVANT